MEATGKMIDSEVRSEIAELKEKIDDIYAGTRKGSLIVPQFIEFYLRAEEKRIKKIYELLEEWKRLH